MISYDLIAGRRLSAPPLVRYTDRPEEWRISCTGRALRPVTSWRAVIATARKIDATTVIAETTEGIAASGVDILVLLDVFFASFRDAVAGAEKGRELWFALWGFAANGKSAEYLEFTFTGFPAIDPPGEDPKDLPIRPTTTLNGLSGPVVLADGDGNPLPVEGHKITVPGGGGISDFIIISDPVTNIPVWDDTYGACQYLDETFTRIYFAKNINDVRRVRLQLVSANPAVTGDIVLIPVVNEVPGEPVVLAVGKTLAKVSFALEFDFGRLELRRDTTDSRDTLRDGDVVTAIVTDAAFEVVSTWG